MRERGGKGENSNSKSRNDDDDDDDGSCAKEQRASLSREKKKFAQKKEGGNVSEDLWDFIVLCFVFFSFCSRTIFLIVEKRSLKSSSKSSSGGKKLKSFRMQLDLMIVNINQITK